MDRKAGTWFSQMQKKWRNTHFYSDLILDRGKDKGKTRTVALGKDRILKSESEDWKIFKSRDLTFNLLICGMMSTMNYMLKISFNPPSSRFSLLQKLQT